MMNGWLDENTLFRPPAEGKSLIFQVTRGCPHNRCLFCGMYKTVSYREYDLRKIEADIECALRQGFGNARRIFLADADAFSLSTEKLESILLLLNRKFPLLSRVSFYAGGHSILSKTPEELRRLKELKASTLYLGLESGSEELLKRVGKACTAKAMAEAVIRAQGCGLKVSVMILLGLGGTEFSRIHAEKTAEVLNYMRPKLLSALRFIEIPGLTPMFKGYHPLSEKDSAVELQTILSLLNLDGTVFRANHSSIPFPLEGRFPKDREKWIATLDAAVKTGILSESGPGPLPLFL